MGDGRDDLLPFPAQWALPPFRFVRGLPPVRFLHVLTSPGFLPCQEGKKELVFWPADP